MADAEQEVFDLMSSIGRESDPPVEGAAAPDGAGDASQTENVPETEEEKQQKRYEYWQARAQRAEAEANKNAFAAPIAKLLDAKPSVALKLQEFLNTEPVEDQGPKRPEPPVRPVNYDPAAAIQDPSSDSFKYREAQDQYREQVTQYLEAQMNAKAQAIQAELEQRKAAEKQQVEMAQMRLLLASKGMKPLEVEEFLQEMANPQTFNADNLIMLHKINKQLKSKKTPPPAAPAGKRPPIPGFGGGGAPVEEPNPEKGFSMGLRKASKAS